MHNPDWKYFHSEHCHFVFHVPTASILQVPEALSQALLENKHDEVFSNLQKHIKSSEELVSSHINIKSTYAKATADKLLNIRHIALNVAERCNLRCTYCYAGQKGDYGSDTLMSFDLAKRSIQFFSSKEKHLEITFFGGEALLNFKLIKNIVEWSSSQQGTYSFSLTSNGVLLNSSHIDFFKKHKFKINISYDGSSAQTLQRTQNLNLTQNIESKLLNFKETLKELRSFHIKATLSKKFIENFPDDMFKILNSYSYNIQYARVASSDPLLKFDSKDVEKLNLYLTQMVESLLKIQAFDKIMRIGNLRSWIRKLHYGKDQAFCGAGLSYLSVSTRGRFYLCHRFTEDEEECVGDIDSGLKLEKLEKIRFIRTHSQEPCKSCWMRKVCKGGCFHENKMHSGNIDRIDPLFCKLQDTEMTLALRIYISLLKRAPQILQEYMK